MEFLAIACGVIGMALTFNLLFSFLYLISKSAGHGLYRWVVHDLDFLMVLSFPIFGITEFVANRLYSKFNWFAARILLIIYAILLFVLAIIFFIIFGEIAGSK
ncbi:hypothetical protein [Pseudalkalibacillus hwajinpoensis]|uniref:Uncharacterized protein n=1 Tax=Guptibacillus hwajinpoensis TaxID=208199 RepID=A0A4U1MKY0_9BACL|nr:hypothetical protein [Pseudalkalibacillus hwajinpoensis]TKD71090.1 hypothetical protein FBF83_09080 [Pseudalkalibacillus hwajinpoensis]